MELIHVKGDTYYLSAEEFIPLYKLDRKRCILLDSGYDREWEGLVQALERWDLEPVGVFSSHAHRDHIGNNLALRQRYGTRLCLPRGEAAICESVLLYKGVYDTYTPQALERKYGGLIGRVDQVVEPDQTRVEFCGVPLEVIHTPGHTQDHICTATPDGVCYVGDALLSGEVLANSRLPYHYVFEAAFQSMERLAQTQYAAYIVAHKAVEADIAPVARANRAGILACMEKIRALADEPVTFCELSRRTMEAQKLLTSKEDKAALYARGMRTIVEYMADAGLLEVTTLRGMRYYQGS